MSFQYIKLRHSRNFDFQLPAAIMNVMNPYEAPQTPLQPESEVRPRVPVAYQSYDPLQMLKIMGVIFLVLIEVSLGAIMLQCFASLVSLDSSGENLDFSRLLPFVTVSFLGIGWVLWKLKQASDRKNS
jgi:hypothetical protein